MADEPILLTVEQVAARLGIARTRVYHLIATGELPSIKLGASRRVEAVEVVRFVGRLRDADATTVDRRVPAGIA
jgi:excisionase family DNA binding protein